MKNSKRIISLMLLFVLAVSLTGCRTQLGMETYEGELSDEAFYGSPELVVRAVVKEKTDSYFTHPLGKAKNNAHVTVFDLEVKEVYKGTCEGEQLELKMFNGKGMSPLLYRYGWDFRYVLDEKVEPFLLQEGQEYILGLFYNDPATMNTYGDSGGYCINFAESWVFVQNDSGLWQNLDDGPNHKELDTETLKIKLAENPVFEKLK